MQRNKGLFKIPSVSFYATGYFIILKFKNLPNIGSQIGSLNIKPEDMNFYCWDYIFKGNYNENHTYKVSRENLDTMRSEFLYWYPMDLRCSGKDLLANHLTYMIYNHVAIFGYDQCPRSIRVNGHMMLNSQKMSKSTGNFMTLEQAIESYGADSTRLALADGGDFVSDANFLDEVAKGFSNRLLKIKLFVEQVFNKYTRYRNGNCFFVLLRYIFDFIYKMLKICMCIMIFLKLGNICFQLYK